MPRAPRPAEYTYDERTGRYRDPRGRFLSPQQIRDELDLALAGERRTVRSLAESFVDGKIDATAFETQMQRHLVDIHLFSAALARGGWAQMTQAAYGQVGGLVGREFIYLDRFMRDVATGRQALDSRFVTRAMMYAGAGRDTYFQAERVVMREQGKTEERNVLHPVEHTCAGPNSCREQSARGWVPIGTLVPIGRRRCLRNCRCHLEYRGKQAPVAKPAARFTDADILALPSSAYPVARAGEWETIKRFTTAEGAWTPERLRLHDVIVRQHFEDATPVAKPTAYVMGGGPASGKSMMLAKLDVPENSLTVDPDHIKSLIPEYGEANARNDERAAPIVHEESSDLAKRVVAQATQGRYNVVIDGTGDNAYDNLAKKVAGYRKSGARVIGNYVTVDTDTALQRAIDRAKKPGPNFNRKVPEDFIREVHRNISAIMPRAIKEGLFDELTLWDTNEPGESRMVLRYVDGHLTIYDEALWQRFLSKAEDTVIPPPPALEATPAPERDVRDFWSHVDSTLSPEQQSLAHAYLKEEILEGGPDPFRGGGKIPFGSVPAIRTALSEAADNIMRRRLAEAGRTPEEIGNAIALHSRLWEDWWKTSSSDGGAILKQMATEAVGDNPVIYHGVLIDHDPDLKATFDGQVQQLASMSPAAQPTVRDVFAQEAQLEQALFKSVVGDRDTVTLWRGIEAEDFAKSAGIPVEEVHQGMEGIASINALSSWTTDRGAATKFGDIVLQAEVPISQIQSSYLLHGSGMAREVIVRGPRVPYVIWSDERV